MTKLRLECATATNDATCVSFAERCAFFVCRTSVHPVGVTSAFSIQTFMLLVAFCLPTNRPYAIKSPSVRIIALLASDMDPIDHCMSTSLSYYLFLN